LTTYPLISSNTLRRGYNKTGNVRIT